MPRPLNTRFVIADGSRARWVERSASADDFVTVRELKAAPETRGEPDGVAFGSSGQRFNISEKNDAIAQRRVRFARTVAEAINAEAEGLERLAVIAPARMLSAISEHLSKAARAKLVRSLSKDLTKTPDHELGDWLRPLERG